MAVADEKGRRLDAATGMAAAVVFLVAALLPGAPPKADDAIDEITSFAIDKRGAQLASDYLLGIGALLFLWFAGSLRSYLRAAEGGAGRLSAAAFGGAVAGVALLLGGAAVINGLVFQVAEQGDDTLVRGLFDVANALFVMSGFALAAFLGASSCSGARSGALPPWLYWTGSVAAVVQLVGAIALFAESGFLAVGGAFGFIAILSALAWVFAVSVVMTQRRGVPPIARTEP